MQRTRRLHLLLRCYEYAVGEMHDDIDSGGKCGEVRCRDLFAHIISGRKMQRSHDVETTRQKAIKRVNPQFYLYEADDR